MNAAIHLTKLVTLTHIMAMKWIQIFVILLVESLAENLVDVDEGSIRK